MRLVVLIVLAALLAGCRTRQLTVEKESSLAEGSFNSRLDSLVELRLRERLKSLNAYTFQASNFSLKSSPVFDSLGNQKPFVYKHYVDGQLKEEIYMEGGELQSDAQSKQETQAMEKELDNAQVTAVKAKVAQEVITKAASNKKVKEVEATGFRFGTLLLWLILLAILWYINRRFKLVDKIKKAFGGKKSPPAI